MPSPAAAAEVRFHLAGKELEQLGRQMPPGALPVATAAPGADLDAGLDDSLRGPIPELHGRDRVDAKDRLRVFEEGLARCLDPLNEPPPHSDARDAERDELLAEDTPPGQHAVAELDGQA